MNNSCRPSESLISSPSFLIFWSHVITVFTLPINVFVSYIVFFHTPKSMNPIRIVILNAQFWSTMCDLMIGTLSIPFVFFPLAAGIPLGILKDFGVPTLLETYVVSCFISREFINRYLEKYKSYKDVVNYNVVHLFKFYNFTVDNSLRSLTVTQILIGFRPPVLSVLSEVGASLLLICEAQQFRICGDHALVYRNCPRRALKVFNYFATFFFLAPAYRHIEMDDSIRAQLLRIVPCPHPLFSSDRFFVANDSLITVASCFATCILVFGSQGFAFVINSCYHLFISSSRSTSRVTRSAQKSFFWAACAQVSLPLFIIGTPIGYIIFSMTTGYYNQGLNNIMFLVISTHGFFNSLATILVYEKYRQNTILKLKVKIREIFSIE